MAILSRTKQNNNAQNLNNYPSSQNQHSNSYNPPPLNNVSYSQNSENLQKMSSPLKNITQEMKQQQTETLSSFVSSTDASKDVGFRRIKTIQNSSDYKCDNQDCHFQGQFQIHLKNTSFTYLSCGILFLLTGVGCWIPFCMDNCRAVEIICPHCKKMKYRLPTSC